MPQIDYFFAPMSPFCYLAGSRLEQIAAKHRATVRYIPLNAPALFPRTGGQVLADRHESRKTYRMQELRRQAAKLGMPINLSPFFFPVNPAPSAYAIIAAAKAGGGDLAGLVQAFPRAVWAEGRNIAEDEVVQDILAAHGFDPKIADKFMLDAAETYMANLEEAVARGVFGVPFYIVGDERFWGQDRLEDLDLHLSGKL
ncbi:MAG: 2-hydroxychromene-2-carboxylate isomerase [Rhodobacteraceae bacterium]|uniref:2-hydroxychromene-2-carboxylate isomerase n=1 Tax=Cypionkella sp. TaxID=2811411 RepID=UPI00132CBEC6|nr:2-hydroxychromene-2-carboxylate isomerase [Cypionkella sp.]KAF0173906.1 MAG: 2-hydroxychromene-2-carboxylate isomerase [Paracoccaceae bacterium]MDO8327155.1 2-hydroxychromene-2-carboxylate isomerase [Cypionkella sp.]